MFQTLSRFVLPCIFCIAVTAHLSAQPSDKPLILQGQITNSTESMLRVFFLNDFSGEYEIDTLKLDADGNFYLKTWKIKRPQRTSIQQNRTQINDLYLAPGYDLTITADFTDFPTSIKTTKITGTGAAANQYKILMSQTYLALADSTKYWELPAGQLAAFAEKRKITDDSLAATIFDKKAPANDAYFKYFGKMVKQDNRYRNLYYLLMAVTDAKFSYEESVAFVNKYIDKTLFTNFSDIANLESNEFRTVISMYFSYQRALDIRKDSNLVKEKNYQANLVSRLLTGEMKEYRLHQMSKNNVPYVTSVGKLDELRERVQPYIDMINNEDFRLDIKKTFDEKEKELIATMSGNPAPAFTVVSDDKKEYTLTDFKGKVVYIDFWASWCVPCRLETPHLKELYKKYKEDKRIEIISIAVSDGEKEWRKALDEDQPEWLQLYATDGKVQGAYAANTIPRFVIIDKEGKIVTMDAPAPSQKEELEKILKNELGK
ncbi:TlpA family protein disulfide reductase [Gynurincola endophyticus]|uniref:TlpA family protein disulfide reductase n=1 Tax=Gynurincola endophyticus TaxID=2479004 RepID=UPI000F8F7688|nr:TlpA disulfide reductase family protein [Gynurincola endophyticus]